MLTRFHKILIAVLVVQLVLAVIVLTRGDDAAALKQHPIVSGFDAAKVTRLQIFVDSTSKPLDVVKRDAGWVLASSFDYPADESKVTDVLSPIAKLAASAPIATQVGRHKQLHVTDAEFERKLVITAAGKDLTLYIGGPAGSRRTAVRLGGDDRVYAATGITASMVGSEPRQWVDPNYLKIPRAEIAKVVVQRDGRTLELSRSASSPPAAAGSGSGSDAGSGAGSGIAAPPAEEHWSVVIAGDPLVLAAGESIDEPAIDRIVDGTILINLSSPADPKRDASRPTATITIERKATGSTAPVPTVLDVIAEESSYWVRDRSLPRAVLVAKAQLDPLLGADRDKLIKKLPPPAPPGAEPAAPDFPDVGPGSGAGAHPPAGSSPHPGPHPGAHPGAHPGPHPGAGSAARRR